MMKFFITVFILLSLYGCQREDTVFVNGDGSFLFESILQTNSKSDLTDFYNKTTDFFSKNKKFETSNQVTESKDTEGKIIYEATFKLSGNLYAFDKSLDGDVAEIEKINKDVFVLYPRGQGGDVARVKFHQGNSTIKYLDENYQLNDVVYNHEYSLLEFNSFVIFLNNSHQDISSYIADLKIAEKLRKEKEKEEEDEKIYPGLLTAMNFIALVFGLFFIYLLFRRQYCTKTFFKPYIVVTSTMAILSGGMLLIFGKNITLALPSLLLVAFSSFCLFVLCSSKRGKDNAGENKKYLIYIFKALNILLVLLIIFLLLTVVLMIVFDILFALDSLKLKY